MCTSNAYGSKLIMMTVIHALILLITVVCTSNAYDSKRNNDTVIHELIFLWCVGIPTSNAHGLKRNDDNGHSCIDITVVCTSNAYDSK